jgi:hypothetical protein
MTSPLDPQTKARRPQTLTERLSAISARVRGEVHGRLGTRAYRVWRVVRRWSGGEVGRGQLMDKERVELRCGFDERRRPTPPRVVLSGQYARSLAGVVEDGMIVLEQLDPTYTEADLVDFGRLDPSDEAYIEVVQDTRDGAAPDRPARRFTIEGAPYRDTMRFQWSLRLREQQPSATFGNAQLANGQVP